VCAVVRAVRVNIKKLNGADLNFKFRLRLPVTREQLSERSAFSALFLMRFLKKKMVEHNSAQNYVFGLKSGERSVAGSSRERGFFWRRSHQYSDKWQAP
jgi:hypothetical protein